MNENNSTPVSIMAANLGRVRSSYNLIRDWKGNPVIDDGDLMPEEAKQKLLTHNEREALKNDHFAWRRNAQ